MNEDPRGRAAAAFGARYGREPLWAARAPGRVNLIGDHTDYNGGFVLPMAIDRECWALGVPSADAAVSRVYSADLDLEVEVDLRRPVVVGEGAAVRGSPFSYVLGVLAQFQRMMGGSVLNLDLALASSVPLGGGLSSSAAVEVSTATLMERMLGMSLNPLEKARLCQRAEHEFAGVPCGIMDQLASVRGAAGHALLIDCATSGITPVRMPADARVLVVNTSVRHALAEGEYAKRRAACELAAAKLGVQSLSEVGQQRLSAAGGLSEEEARCVRHVVTENTRVLAAADAIRSGDLESMGRLMHESHASLRDDYRVSCPELDTVVEALMSSTGVYGARMTGAGFGGCAVAMVRPECVRRITDAVSRRYSEVHGRACDVFVVRAAEGSTGGHGPPLGG